MVLSEFFIELSLNTLITFLLGILAGAIFVILLYAYSILITIKDNEKKIEKIDNIKDEEVIQMIHDAKQNYLILRKSANKEIAESALKDILGNIIMDIARKCNPESKKPLFELTIDEAILLSQYITKRVDELLNHRGLGIFRQRLRISQILRIAEMKKKVDNNIAVKATKKIGAPKVISTIWMGLNVLNPFYWVKKLITGVSTNIIMKKIFLLLIDIVGQETYKIYSKSAIAIKDEEFEKALSELNDAAEEIDVIEHIAGLDKKSKKKEVQNEILELPLNKKTKAK